MTLIKDLLTENRYWTFWSADWSTRVNVFWGGKTSFIEVNKQIGRKYFGLGTTNEVGYGYERQVIRTTPDISFK